MRRLAASDLLPERAGQPVRAWVHISLADLMRLDGSSALLEEWTAQVRARWAARRAGASEGGGDGGPWLDAAAAAITCDAAMAPVVTGEINPDALDELIRLCVQLDRHRRGAGHAGGRAAVTSRRPPARSTTRNTRPTAATPASRSACFCAASTTRWPSTAGAGPWS
jgi:hypothetical protein